MKTKSLSGLIIAGVLITSSQAVLASRDVAVVDNQEYIDECGACHFAFQPGLLPERSWKKIMASLDKHFGENAELPSSDAQALTDYLVKNAGDHSSFKRSVKFMRSISSAETPLRISKIPYFVKEHREVVAKIKDSTKVKSISNCEACHLKAADGSYAEREINIPGIGRWED